jgi:hypothetical protein
MSDDQWPGVPAEQWPGTPSAGGETPSGPTPQQGYDWGDIAKSAGRGLVKGAIGVAGFPGDVSNLVGKGVKAVGSAVGLPEPSAESEKQAQRLPTSAGIQEGVEKVTGPLGEAKTTPGKYAESVGEFIPASLAGGENLMPKMLSAIAGGTGAEFLDEQTQNMPYARLVGGFLGALSPGVAAKAITPMSIPAHRQGYVDSLRAEGVEPTAGQVTGRRPLQYMESHWGESPLASQKAAETLQKPLEQFTRAALARVGVTADRATPEVIDKAFGRIGKQFDDLSARNSAPVDQQYIQDLFKARSEYDHLFVDPLRKPVVESVVDHAVNQLVKTGKMDGTQYKALRSRIERMRRDNQKDPEVSMFLGEVRDSMDNLMERGIKANNPADLGAWKEVRRQYRNMLPIEGAVTGAETKDLISPAKLRQGVVKQDRRGYARGKGDYGELAKSGNVVLESLPQSGTAPRQLTSSGILHQIGTGAAGTALMSPAVQAYLKNQALAGVRTPGARSALTSAGIAANVGGDQ